MDSNATASDEIEAAKTSLAAQIEDRDVLLRRLPFCEPPTRQDKNAHKRRANART